MDECKVCANADNEYCFACDNGNQFKPVTNADRIRAMSDEELAEWITQILTYHGSFSRRPLTIDDHDCPHECPLYKCCNDQPTDNIEGWLKAPVEVET